MNSKASSWIGGTAVVALLLLVAGWFLLVSPSLDGAAQASTDAQSVEDQNRALQIQINKLKDQTEHLAQYQADLASLRKVVPTEAGLADYNRSLGALADRAGVTILKFGAGTPVPVLPTDPAADPAQAGADGAATDASPTPSPTPTASAGEDPAAGGTPPATTTVAPIQGFVAMPIDVTVVGDVSSVLNFVGALQQGSPRPFLVTQFTGAGTGEQQEQDGHPATKDGDLELALSGFVYVLQDTSQPSDAPADGEDETGTLPHLRGGKDSFVKS